MKTRLFIATLLLLAFGSMKAQDTITVKKNADTIRIITPNTSELPELMQELGVYLQMLTDSVDWKSFEKDMEKWGEDMEEWDHRMEQWGEEFEKRFDRSLRNNDSHVHAIQVEGSGDVRVEQSLEGFSLRRSNKEVANHYVANGTLVLSGSSDYEVALPQLDEVTMHSSGDVVGRGIIKGKNLRLALLGSGDLWLDVDYDTIRVEMFGSGDVALKGKCRVIYGEIKGSGDLQIPQLHYAESYINATGSGEVWTNNSRDVIHQRIYREKKTHQRGFLFDANWNGFEAGLNMLFNTPVDVVNANNGAHGMEIRPLRSWYFGFNFADVGVAFDRKHTAGLFTGIGLGWNNYSWNNDVKIEYDSDNVVYTLVPIEADQIVKNSKYGALFLQMPLMVEVRPTRYMYIDAGVTGGLRIAQWNRVKLADGTQTKRYFGASINQFKLDASLRIGYEGLGFFANYALLPIFDLSNAKVHPLSFGFSIGF